MAKHPRFEITKDRKGEFRFRLTATNGQVILVSQGYADKAGCKKGITSVRTNCGKDARFERGRARNGKHYFNLLSGNRQVVGSSQMYASKASMENAVRSVGNNASRAEIEDQT